MMPRSTSATLRSGVEAPQAADRQLFLVVHPAREEAAAPVALAVVQPGPRLVRVDPLDQVELARAEIEEVEAVVEREDRAAALAQRHGAHELGRAACRGRE